MDLDLRTNFLKLRRDYKNTRNGREQLDKLTNPIILQLRWCNVNTTLAVFSGRYSLTGYAAIGASTSIQNIIDARGLDIDELSEDFNFFKKCLKNGLIEQSELFPPLFRKVINNVNANNIIDINILLSKFPVQFLDVVFSNPPAIRTIETAILACSKRQDLSYIPIEIWDYMFLNFIY
jgi:hypothetical protein